MKPLYESLLADMDSTIDKGTTAIDMYGTTAKIFKKMKNITPETFGRLRNDILDGISIKDSADMYGLTHEEMYAVTNFIKHMHEKYGQMDIFITGWCLSEPTWKLNEIHKGMGLMDKDYILNSLNLPFKVSQGKVDYWMVGLGFDSDSEVSWLMCTLKAMSKEEKQTWLEIMKAVERYYK